MIPYGYMQNSTGALIPEDKVKPEHKLEDELVRGLVAEAAALRGKLAAFRAQAMGDVEAFRDLLAQKYETKLGGQKGNLTLSSYDGTLRVQVSVSDHLAFGPELQVAKTLVDGCVARWSEGSSANMRALVDHAFQVNKQGRIDTARVLTLRTIKIEDPDWLRAMEAIADAIRVVASKTYVRFYEVDPATGDRTQIPLDIASV